MKSTGREFVSRFLGFLSNPSSRRIQYTFIAFAR